MKNYMPLNGLRWSRDSGSANCDMLQSDVLGRPGGGSLAVFLCQSDAGLSLGETACWRFLPYWRSVRNLEKWESDTSENTNEPPRKLKMNCFENYEWPCVIPYE